MNKGILITLLSVCLCTLSRAQEDSIKVQPKAEPSIFSMKMQRRFIPTDAPFHPYETEGRSFLRALENTSISLSGGYRHWLDAQASSGPMVTLAVQKWISPRHGLRLEGGSGYFMDLDGLSRVVLLPDLRLSHVFNLSAWLNGFDPSAAGTLYTLGGAGYQWRKDSQGETQGTWVAQLGFGYSLSVGRGIALFAEPLFELDGNRFLQREDGNWRGYYTAFRGNVGLSYRIDRWNSLLPPREEHRWFLVAAGAPIWRVHSTTSNTDMGYQFMLGAGQKTTPSVSLRLSASWAQLYRAQERSSAYGALRLEALLDPLVLAGRSEDARWGISLLAGPEAGFLDGKWDSALFGNIGKLGNRFYYLGGTAGLQLRAGLFPRTWLLLEPRASFIPYSTRSGRVAQNALDILLSAQLGFQYDIRPSLERAIAFQRMQAWEKDRRKREMERKEHLRERWQQTMDKVNFYVSAEGSYFRPLGRVYASGPLASLSLGTWFTPLHGMLVNGGLGYFQDLKYGNGYVKTSDFSAAYLFNMTRFSKGEDAKRQLNASLLLGAGYMLPLKEIWDGSVVFRTGLDLRMHVLTRTDLVMRPEVNFLQAPSKDWTPALRGSFGLSYSMGGDPLSRFTADGKEWYAFTGAGYQHEIVRLSDHAYEEAPLGEYRISAGVGRRYTDRLDWRLSLSYLSQPRSQVQGSFAHRLRMASVNLDALYKLFGDNLDQWKWSLSLVGGPEVGLQHKAITGENSKGSGLILHRTTVSAYRGFSAGAQVKYHLTDALAAYLEPRYTIAPYVAITSQGEENYYTHLYGANLGLEYSFGREQFRPRERFVSEQERAYTFVQASATAFRPFGRAYAHGPLASIGVGHWFQGVSAVLLEAGAGYFRDNQYSKSASGRAYFPQHMASIEMRASYLLSLTRLASRRHELVLPVDVALIGGVGVLMPEFRQADLVTPTFHGGFDFRVPVLPGTDFVFQPQLELLQDPHAMMDGSEKNLIGAFRGTFGLSYNWSSKYGRIPATDPGKDWFVAVGGGYQREWDRLSDITGEEVARDEYRLSMALGRRFSPAISMRVTGSYSKLTPQESSFLHSVRYLSVNGDLLYDLLAGEDAPGRVSLSLLAGPEAGLFNKNYNGVGNEYPMTLPIRVGRRVSHGIGVYIGISAGTQVRVRLWRGLSAYLEQRYSLVPYVSAYGRSDHRNMTSQLWNLNLGLQYSFE